MLGSSLAALTGSVLYPIVAYLKPPKSGEVEVSTVKAGKVDEFDRDSGQIIKFGTKPVLLVRTQEGEFRAFSAVCTHLDCTVQYRREKGTIWCACHNGTYDLTGRNIAGPPPRPLDEFRVIVQGEEVLISKKA
ncbi:MAG TPA: Rieske (2Fe-2S) protein [Bacteroidota bacterium]|nr:Rieske (2Fe-2S) protein [Bacteroidota bacterium]